MDQGNHIIALFAEWWPLLAVAVAMVSALLTRIVLGIARARGLLAQVNERSSHAVPTPHGGGIGVLAALLPGWVLYTAATGQPALVVWLVPGLALFLAALSWLDDLRPLSPLMRLVAQGAAVAAVLSQTPADWLHFGGLLPPLLDHLLAGVAWLWFINLFNFMDGIDGLAGTETVTIGAGAALVAAAGAALLAPLGWIVAAAALGFLWWNRPPARIFMGDVGSVPLGFVLGWLLLTLAAAGHHASALILPLYYLADATITLLRRAARGEKVWQAHREHFYQRAVRAGLGHGRVVGMIAVANAGLVLLAVWAAYGEGAVVPWAALTLAAVLVAALLWRLQGARA